MRSKHLLLMLLLALMAPWAAAQTQETFTVYATETGTNDYIPIYGLWGDANQQSEFIIPASELADIACGTISKLTFHISSTTADKMTGTAKVYLREVDATSFTSPYAYYGIEGATQVYEGEWDTKTSVDVELPFTSGVTYTYNGGNLLVGFIWTTAGDYKSASILGKTFASTAPVTAIYKYGSGSITAQRFIPRTTFTYTPSPYAAPATIDYTNNSPGNTTVSWTAPTTTETITGYAYRYKKTSVPTWPAFESVPATTLSKTLELDPETKYEFEVKTLYGTNESCSTKKVTFTTLSSCMTPEDLTITNVTWNSATFTWTEAYGNGTWKFGYKKSSETAYNYVNVVAADLPITLNVFEEQTEYNVVVYPLCDEAKTIEGSFTTACAPMTSVDWTENFNSYTTGIATSTSAPTGYPDVTLPDCWQFLNRSTSSSEYPMAFLSSYSSYAVSGNCLFFKSSSTTPLYAILPQFTEAINTLQLCFTYRNENVSSNNGTLVVGYMTDPTDATTFHTVYTCAQTTTKTPMEVPFPSEASGYMAFKYQGGTSSNYYLSIDDVSVEPIPACGRPETPMVAPNTLTNHSAKLTWTAPEGQEAWQIAYSTTSFDPNAANFDLTTVQVIDVTANPYTFDKTLNAATTYYMYVRGNCGTDGYSKWCKNACSFTTKVANPAPTGLTVTNVGSRTADVYWTAGGGDTETWEVYYTDDATFDIADYTTGATSVSTLPTSETPLQLTSLTPEASYRLWVRANHGTPDGYSNWTSPKSFTMQVACPKPTNLAAVPSHTTADLTWTGYSDSYTVEYQTSAYNETIFFEDFESGSTGWTTQIEGEGPGWALSTDYSHSTSHSMTAYSYDFSNYSSYDADNWLISPQITMGKTLKFWAYQRYGDEYEVLFSTSNSISSFDTELQAMATVSPSQTWVEFTVDLTDIMGQTGYIAIHHEMYDGGWLSIDDFGIYGDEVPAGGWTEATTSATDGAYTIEGLTAGTKYDVRVKGNCGGEYSDVYSFTTLDNNTKIFTTAGNWNVDGNWEGGIPTIANNAIIRANATVPADYDATANSITFEGTTTPTLTIKDGGQLHTNATVTATFEKEIVGYTGTKDNYYLICPPNDSYYSVNPTGITGMLTGDYDLYAFDGTQEGAEWRNYEASAFNMEIGKGFLYANATDVTLKYTGIMYKQQTDGNYDYLNWNATAQDVDYLNYNTTTLFGTFNLVGNTLPHNAYVYVGTEETTGFTPVQTYYYKMNDEHNEVVVSNHEVKPWEGIFVQATAEEQYAIIKSDNLGNPALTESLSMSLSQNNSLTDVAIVNFGKGNNLGKFQLNPNHTKLYIPQDDKDYAVVYSEEKAGELPVSFKAEKNGSYTLSFSNENVEFGYLHLIDNMTGEDVNLLETPSYSFEAKTTDYASRFKLVFSTGNGVNDESFAFISDGNIILNGEGMLQVVDVMGRIMMQEENATSVSTNGMTPGVYVLRLINGDNVRTQKIVVK